MTLQSTFVRCGILGLSLSVAACATDGGIDDPLTSETQSNLLVSAWGNQAAAGSTYENAAVATINGKTIQVAVGDNTGVVYDGDHTSLYWRKMVGNNVWTDWVRIAGQAANSKVSLAAFNGYIYMVHTGESDSSATWYSKFDPTTETWSNNAQIPAYPSYNGPPAIVAYNNLLYFIASQSNGVMWVATMTPGEAFSTPIGINHHTSTGRPSAAVLYGKLYIAHTLVPPNDTTLVVGAYDGTDWTYPVHIKNGTSPDIYGREAALATDQGILHLVHTTGTSDSEQIHWTYFDGCNWAGSEVTLNDWRTSTPPALTQGGPGLVLMTTSDDWDWFWQTLDKRDLTSYTYTHPRITRPPVAPICNIVAQP